MLRIKCLLKASEKCPPKMLLKLFNEIVFSRSGSSQRWVKAMINANDPKLKRFNEMMINFAYIYCDYLKLHLILRHSLLIQIWRSK